MFHFENLPSVEWVSFDTLILGNIKARTANGFGRIAVFRYSVGFLHLISECQICSVNGIFSLAATLFPASPRGKRCRTVL